MSWLTSILEALSNALSGQTGTLIVAVPLLAAPIAAVQRRALPAAVIALAVGVFCVALSALLIAATGDGPLLYALGGWEPPLGIAFHIDRFNALVALMVSGGFLAAVLYACAGRDAHGGSGAQLAGMGILCLTGLLGVVLTGDLFNMFVFLEISSLSAYALIGAGGWRDRRALKAAFDYLIVGSIGASFFVIGVGFLYAVTGTLNMADMAARLDAAPDNRAVRAGFAFIVAGLGLKAAMFPVHQWLPPSYAHAPSAVTVFLSASATKVALYALARILFDVAGPQSELVHAAMTWVIAPMAALAAIVCSAKALFAPDIRRVFAWSSVAQVGYMMMAVSIGSAAALSAGLFHMLSHAMFKSAVFMAVGSMTAGRVGTVTARALAGAVRSAPATICLFGIAGLSLAGMPPTLGFVSKWLLFEAFVSAGWNWAVVVLAISSLLSFAYVGKILLPACMEPPDPESPTLTEAPTGVLMLLAVLVAAHIGFGLYSAPIADLTASAAAALFTPDVSELAAPGQIIP